MTDCYRFRRERMATELSIPMDLLRLSLLFFSYLIKVITCSYFDANYLLIDYINMAFNMLEGQYSDYQKKIDGLYRSI